MAEVRAVLRISDQCRQVGIEMPRGLRRIDEPLRLIWLEPTEAIADDDATSRLVTVVGARAVYRSAEPDQRIARLADPGPRPRLAHFSRPLPPITSRPHPPPPLSLLDPP